MSFPSRPSRGVTMLPSAGYGLISRVISGYLYAFLGQVVAITFIALLLRAFPVFHFSSALVLLVVVLIALRWGVGPSLFALLLGAILLLLLVLPFSFSFTVIHTEDAVGVLLYFVVGLTNKLQEQ